MAKVKHYITADGYDPFDAYLRSVKDPIAKAMIATRVARMSTGNYGDCKPCRESVSELRINQAGLPCLFQRSLRSGRWRSESGATDWNEKKQSADIERAVEYLNDYKRRI